MPKPLIVYKWRGFLKKAVGGRWKPGIRLTPAYSATDPLGHPAEPWMTREACKAAAREQGARAVFEEQKRWRCVPAVPKSPTKQGDLMPPYKKQCDSTAIDDGWTITDGEGEVIAHLDTETMADAMLGCLRGERFEVRTDPPAFGQSAPPAFKQLAKKIKELGKLPKKAKVEVIGRECGGVHTVTAIQWFRGGEGSVIEADADKPYCLTLCYAAGRWCDRDGKMGKRDAWETVLANHYREPDGPDDAEEPITLASLVTDYCREEADDVTKARAMLGWLEDLTAAGEAADAADPKGFVIWHDHSSISGAELAWSLHLRDAFWLALNRGWFDAEGVDRIPRTIAAILTDRETDADGEPHPTSVAAVAALWSAFRNDPANKETNG